MDDSHAKRILTLLILYRWASLLPPAVADAKATMASAEVRLDVPRVPERWNNRHNRNMFIVRLRR